MATIKQLLDSFAKAGSKFAYPQDNSVTIWTAPIHADDYASWNDRHYYTPPKDGIVSVYSANNENVYIIDTKTGTDAEPQPHTGRRGWAIVRKGKEMSFVAFNPTKTVDVYFQPLLGQS